MPNYQQIANGLEKDEYMLLQGLAHIYAGVQKPISPTSSDFAIEYGIKDAIEARKNLMAKHIIDDHYEFADREFRAWIWRQIFGSLGNPPAANRVYDSCDRLEDNLSDS